MAMQQQGSNRQANLKVLGYMIEIDVPREIIKTKLINYLACLLQNI